MPKSKEYVDTSESESDSSAEVLYLCDTVTACNRPLCCLLIFFVFLFSVSNFVISLADRHHLFSMLRSGNQFENFYQKLQPVHFQDISNFCLITGAR